ncbi:MAG: peptidoglycan bridge formation glycyltransferase FemA/FemB family protein [Chloroflexota bacterium]|nr:peptidoglycan bridge formation glycyltransferase FemA/FemB family protein [Chloroflexota bacterium]
MKLTYVTNETKWDHAILNLPLHHILQSWAWGAFKSRWGWTPTRLLWGASEVVAAAQFLRRAIPYTPFGIAYVSKGPLLDADNLALATRVLSDIEVEARRQRCLFVKIDPDVLASNRAFVRLLEGRGWRRGEPIQFPNTGIIDLQPDTETLLMDMKSKTRYNIRLAGRRGVQVREATAEQFSLFYEMYAETAERDGFLIRPRAYYLDLWNDFHRRGLANLLLAWVKETPVAGLILFRFGIRAWYFYGASTELHRRDMPAYALQWAAIQWAKAQGATEYDLWGAPTNLDDPDDPMAGVWRFKEGFNAHFREQIGAWDYPTNTLGYRLYTEGVPEIRKLLSRVA